MLVDEFTRGVTTGHLQKANQKIIELQRLYREHGSAMDFNDLEIALQLLEDLRAAVRLFSLN